MNGIYKKLNNHKRYKIQTINKINLVKLKFRARKIKSHLNQVLCILKINNYLFKQQNNGRNYIRFNELKIIYIQDHKHNNHQYIYFYFS